VTAPRPTRRIALPVAGMDCASCVRTIERALQPLPGVAEASVNFAAQSATIHLRHRVAQGAVTRALRTDPPDIWPPEIRLGKICRGPIEPRRQDRRDRPGSNGRLPCSQQNTGRPRTFPLASPSGGRQWRRHRSGSGAFLPRR